jgi:hypothetical protein
MHLYIYFIYSSYISKKLGMSKLSLGETSLFSAGSFTDLMQHFAKDVLQQ